MRKAIKPSYLEARNRLDAIGLKPTLARITVLQVLLDSPEHWSNARDLYKDLTQRGEVISLSSVYRAVSEMLSLGLLLVQTDLDGKRYYRMNINEHSSLHWVQYKDAEQPLPFFDETLRERLAEVLLSAGLSLDDTPITVHVASSQLDSPAPSCREHRRTPATVER